MKKNTQLANIQVHLLSVDALSEDPRNARMHSADQVQQIAASIKEFGFTNPLLISKDNTVIAGHGRLAAAKLLGLNEVPTILLGNLTPEQQRAYIIADNKLALNASWDMELLSVELQAIIDGGVGVSLTGFTGAEADYLIKQLGDLEATAHTVSQELDTASFKPAHTCPECGHSFDD